MSGSSKVLSPANHDSDVILLLRKRELREIRKVSKLSHQAKLDVTPELKPQLIKKVDYTAQIPFVRHQGAWGCGMYAAATCWDIMNELACPHSPNLSVNRMLWAHNIELRKESIPAINLTYKTMDEYMVNFGCPTEGTELTDSDAVCWPFQAGDLECPNFRQKETPLIEQPFHAVMVPVKVDVDNLKFHLAKHPLRITVMNNAHFVALIGYDDGKKRFKFINSWGDQ